MSKIKHILFLCIISGSLMAQEYIAPLHTNPVLQKYAATHRQMRRARKATSLSMDTIPFLDDFSKPGPYPDTSKWTDGDVFVNYNLPVCPPTLGVATFDGLNRVGMPYNSAASPYSSSPADTLTSHPINFGSHELKPSDSLYLSFYYQAGSQFGKGTFGLWPKTNDTLLLQFHKSWQPDSVWQTVWYHLGYTHNDTDSSFHMVMIPLVDTAYLKNGFRFRFRNYACTSGNVDHWSIDEVYLNALRYYADTTQHDVAFAYEAPSLLANYQYEPWEQYAGTGDFKPNMQLFERNNNASASVSGGNIVKVLYTDSINTTPATGYNGGYQNLNPFVDSGYNTYAPQSNPPLITTNFPPLLSAATTYTVTHIFNSSTPDFNRWNDTLRFKQVFDDYYAYDDGTAEASYFINGFSGVPAYLADEFNINKADTIFGVNVFFDYVFVNSRNYTFEFAVWNANGPGGSPGNMIYEDTVNIHVSNPDYDTTGVGRFVTYFLQKPIAVNPGNIYVGWVQTYGDSLNIGIDFNTDHHDKVYYCIDTKNWNQSTYSGSIMFRPLLGNVSSFAGVNNISNATDAVTLYPNPAANTVYLNTALRNATVRILGEDGRLLWEDTRFSGNSINTSELPAGFYIVQLTPQSGKTVFKKLLISR